MYPHKGPIQTRSQLSNGEHYKKIDNDLTLIIVNTIQQIINTFLDKVFIEWGKRKNMNTL